MFILKVCEDETSQMTIISSHWGWNNELVNMCLNLSGLPCRILTLEQLAFGQYPLNLTIYRCLWLYGWLVGQRSKPRSEREFKGYIPRRKTPTQAYRKNELLTSRTLQIDIDQWLFLVPLIGGRQHIITQLVIYTTYIPLIYCQLGDYMLPTTYQGNQKQPLN